MHIKLRDAPAQEAHAVLRPCRYGNTNTHKTGANTLKGVCGKEGGNQAALRNHRTAEEKGAGERRGDEGQRIPPVSIIY